MKGVGCVYNGGVTSSIYFMHNYFFENWVGPKMKEKKYICEKVVLTAIFILFFIFSFFLFFIIKKMGNKHLNTKNSTKGSATSYNESNRRPKERGEGREMSGRLRDEKWGRKGRV